MYTSSPLPLSRTFLNLTAVFGLVAVSTIFTAQCCRADQASLSLSSLDQAQVQWTSGPADASLGTLADIKVPKGYRFTDSTGASTLLGRMNNPVPDGLVGILAPESGQWWAVLVYRDIGFVKDADKETIDAKSILQTIFDRAQRQNEARRIHGLPLITSVDWSVPPVFDAKTFSVEWAVLAKTQSAGVINHTIRLLGRQGILDATAVEPYQGQAASGLVPLNALMKNISFKPGERYVDYQAGDKISAFELAGLISGDDDASAAPADATTTSNKSAGVWVRYVLIGGLAGGGVMGIMLVRGVVQQRRKAHRAPLAGVSGNGVANGNGHAPVLASAVAPVPARPVNHLAADPLKAGDKPKVVVASNGSRSTHRQGARRRKIFDYHRFYTDTVMKLSSSGYTAEVPPRNGHTNGRANGHSLAPAMEAQAPSYGATNQSIIQAHLDLINNQKELIEEQKRLMMQQAKLIDEKTKLIAEKSQLLDRQTELFERDLL